MVFQLSRLQFWRHYVQKFAKIGVVILYQCKYISVHRSTKTVVETIEASLSSHTNLRYIRSDIKSRIAGG